MSSTSKLAKRTWKTICNICNYDVAVPMESPGCNLNFRIKCFEFVFHCILKG